MTDEAAMRRAIETCRQGLAQGQSPFGAVIVKDREIIADTHNTVRSDQDPTAHAEINAIRAAARSLKSFDLSGCVLYSTCEPCPMCLAAAHWSRIDQVIFGASIADAHKSGFRELTIPAAEMIRLGGSQLKLQGGLLTDECRDLFNEWKRSGNAEAY